MWTAASIPLRDIETIDLELIFADLEVLEGPDDLVIGRSARNDGDAAAELAMMQRLKAHLEEGKKAISFERRMRLRKRFLPSMVF